MYPYIVADIGGTNARFALVSGKKNHQFQLSEIRILNGQDYPSLAEALRTYIDDLGGIQPQAICAAIAGPVRGDFAKMTNLSWSFSCKAMREQFGVTRFLALNDFAAVAAATGQITPEHLISIKPGTPDAAGNKAVFGPGTGLGVAGVVNNMGTWIPLAGEGGHVNIAPADALEADIIKAAMTVHGHVSAEKFISGPGLVNLYHALAKVRDTQTDDLRAADITKAALADSDALCRETLEVFCGFVGSFAGNLALTYGATGGVYMAGGILPRFAEFLKASRFSERFNAKGAQEGYVKPIPADLIVHPEVAFTGAAAWLEQQLTQSA